MMDTSDHPEPREGSKGRRISRKARNDKADFEEKKETTAEIKNNHKTMSKKKTIFFGIIIIVVIVLAVWAGVLIAGMQSGTNPDAASPYSAVYLSTGDIYFGKLSWFPSPHMTDVWFIERSQGQDGQTQVGFAPLTSVAWGPTDGISFNAQDIVFSTRLKNSSQIVQVMENPSSVTAQQGGSAGASGIASSTVPSMPTGPSAASTTK
jgi:hypothetical protein